MAILTTSFKEQDNNSDSRQEFRMNRYWIPIAVCSLAVAVVSFFKLSGKDKKKTPKPADRNKMEDASERQSELMDDRVLYNRQISDKEQYSLIIKRPAINPNIDSLKYEILLNLNKGTDYEGVVKIKTVSYKKNGNNSNLQIDFNGKSILYLSVNGRRLDEQEVLYLGQKVILKKQWLQREQNNIEIIFSNRYAFMGNGLTSYFPLDDNNKYSLKGQVIYSQNGVAKVHRIIPCFNILNACEVKLEVLHPDNFQAFSNTPRSLMRTASKQQYPFYGFFFQANDKKLNRSFRLNTSGFIENNSSIRSYEEVLKSNTQFYEAKLVTIHDFFVLSSMINEVRPTNAVMACKDILIRYFAKDHLIKKAIPLINILHCQIASIATRINQYKVEKVIDIKCSHKVDIFFIDDVKTEGDFYVGSILLNESTIERGVCDRRMFYFLCRAFVGMGLHSKNQHESLSLEGKLRMQELTLEIFPECTDFIYSKQKQYEKIHRNFLTLCRNPTPKYSDLSYWAQEFYEKQFRYFTQNLDMSRVSPQLNNLITNIDKLSNSVYWSQFEAAQPFLQFTASEVLIKIGIREKGIPTDEAQLQYAKSHFSKSKYYLKFFTNDQIQNDLQKFIENKSYGIEKKIPFIRIKERYLKLIGDRLENYLSIKDNRLEAKNLYEQFKRYNESRNFHHITALRREVKRIRLLAADNIIEQHREIECGLAGWKLLRKLEIYPEHEPTAQLLNQLEAIKTEFIE